jgi:hypothetical protein
LYCFCVFALFYNRFMKRSNLLLPGVYENLNSPDWGEHPALFLGRCGRKAGTGKPEKAQAIRS